jgi:hypothetical protein
MISPRLVFIIAAFGPWRLAIAWPKHLARGGRFVDRRRVRLCVQELGAPWPGSTVGGLSNFRFRPGKAKFERGIQTNFRGCRYEA